MDLSGKSFGNMDELAAFFELRMREYEDKLRSAVSSAPESLQSLGREFADFKSTIMQMLSMMKSQLEFLTVGVDRHETYIRRKVLLFHGVPEDKDEVPAAKVVQILTERMALPDVCPSDLSVCHRLGQEKGRPRPLLARFSHLKLRNDVWSSKTALRGSGVTVSEFLTQSKHQIFMAARKHFGMHHCWSSDGMINIKLPDDSRRKVDRMSVLQSLIKLHPSAVATDSSGGSKQGSQRTESAARGAATASGARPLVKSPRKLRKK